MSSTRLSNPGTPMSFEKYMSAPEFAAQRPLPGNAVLSKALLYTDAKTRELALFLQAMSMLNGGLKAVAEQLVAWFPDRCLDDNSESAQSINDIMTFCDLVAEANGTPRLAAESLRTRTISLLSEFLVELALNPKVNLSQIACPCFADLGFALQQYKQTYEASIWNGFVLTTAAAIVKETLDQALALSRMVVIEGMAGAGKSTNAKAWCAARPGLVRYISLTGITNRTTFFQKVGGAIGLSTCQRKAQELQLKIEDFFARSKMMLVIDEAHFLWPQGTRRTAAPELIDWIDTALVNYGVPVGLLCTDQFSKLKNRVERNSGWTSEQFIHRVFRFKKLDDKPTQADVINVTRSLLSSIWDEKRQQWIPSDHDCSQQIVEVVAHYSMEQTIPFSCAASCIQEARGYARASGRLIVTKADIKLALGSGQIPSDAALSRAFSLPPAERRGRRLSGAVDIGRKPTKAFVSTPRRTMPVDPACRLSSTEQMTTAPPNREEVVIK